MKNNNVQMKRHYILGKTIVGIDPAKHKHQVMVIDAIGDHVGKTFSFANSYTGFHKTLWHKLSERLANINPSDVVFAVEISINYWQKLCHYLHSKGFTVLMISPLATKHERPKMSNSFTRTDPKDALAVANNARQGYFNFYKEYSDQIKAMHRLSITYDKINKDLTCLKQRLRAQVELLFPEFFNVVNFGTETAQHLLSRLMTARDFRDINLLSEVRAVRKASRNQYDLKHLKALKETAAESIGTPVIKEAYTAERLTMSVWLNQIKLLNEQLKIILDELVTLARQTDYFDILTSLKGISAISAARFIAENRELSEFNHYKKIEAFAGINLRLSDSGQYSGYRRITHIGHSRLRAILYRMAEETKNHIPEVRIRYLKRQMKQARYKKNVVAVSSNLLKLIAALIRENRTYQFETEKLKELQILEVKYQEFKDKRKSKKYKKAS
jgi:transposase